jgi:hypothetical protein
MPPLAAELGAISSWRTSGVPLSGASGPNEASPTGGTSALGRGGTHLSKPSPSRRLPSSQSTMHFRLY